MKSPNFLDAEVHLAGSMFTAEDLCIARLVFDELFKRYSPSWLAAPKGYLAVLWQEPYGTAPQALIDIAMILDAIRKNIRSPCAEIFGSKFVSLLNCKRKMQFDETIAELRFGEFLAYSATPILLEPLTFNYDLERSVTPKKSPDYSIRILDHDILVEVTKLRIQVILDWKKQMELLRERLRIDATSAGLQIEVEIHSPMGISAQSITKPLMRKIVERMKTHESGVQTIEVSGKAIKVVWRKMLRLAMGQKFPLDSMNFSAIEGGGNNFVAAHASSIIPILDESMENIFVRSLRNTLDQKRKQFRIDAHAILIVEFDSSFPKEYVLEIITRRIWPSNQYNWLNAIGITYAPDSFQVGLSRGILVTCFNPNSRVESFDALVDVFEGRARFSKGKLVGPVIEITPAG